MEPTNGLPATFRYLTDRCGDESGERDFQTGWIRWIGNAREDENLSARQYSIRRYNHLCTSRTLFHVFGLHFLASFADH